MLYKNAYGYNFGDAMGPEILKKVAGRAVHTVDAERVGQYRKYERNLFALGSIFHIVKDGDVVWGTGVNPTYPNPNLLRSVDIRAVRGPLTREYLISQHGLSCPEIYGDPALLLPKLFSQFKPHATRKYAVIPHLKQKAL